MVIALQLMFCIDLELHLDLSMLDYRLLEFEAWMEDLGHHRVAFDSSLRIVKLPELQCTRSQPCSSLEYGLRTGDSAPVPSIFNYLVSDTNGRPVRRILEENVRDCSLHPHSNSSIRKCLGMMEVKLLNWRKKDLDLNVIKSAAPNVEELTLYSSGNEDVLTSWTSYKGLYELINVSSNVPVNSQF